MPCPTLKLIYFKCTLLFLKLQLLAVVAVFFVYFFSYNDVTFNSLEKPAEEILISKVSKCTLADLQLDEPEFQKILDNDNKMRSYKPRCLASSWRLFDSTIDSKLVRVNGGKEFWNTTTCCYTPFTRQPKDDTKIIESTECYTVDSDEMKLPAEHEFIKIECTSTKNNKTEVIYSDLLSFVSLKPEVEERVSKYEKSHQSDYKNNKRVTVIMTGLDAVSQANFLRYLPETHQYIMSNLSGIHFPKYHRVSEFSFDNMVVLHMGMNRSELTKACYPTKQSFLDPCPLIWKEFAKKGFRTVYTEDAVPWSVFWYRGDCVGFVDQPSDYYHLTMTRRMEDFYKGEPTPSVCYGDKYNHKVVIENILQTAFTLKDKPYFQFAWMCAMTHNTPIMTKYTGNSLIEMFEELKKRELMENTVFMLFGDHGMNFGAPKNTNQGNLEANLPFFYMVFPQWFSLKYPRAMANLKKNSQLLTSHYDTHETLKDFLDLDTITDESIMKREIEINYDKARGISLFLPVPENRDCQSAGILSKYCSCWKVENVSVDDNPLAAKAQKVLQRHFNAQLKSKGGKCLEIQEKFGVVKKAKCTMPTSEEVRKNLKLKHYETLRVPNVECVMTFEIEPSRKTLIAYMSRFKKDWTFTSIQFQESTKDDHNNIADCF